MLRNATGFWVESQFQWFVCINCYLGCGRGCGGLAAAKVWIKISAKIQLSGWALFTTT